MSLKIYHNPRCSKSREALALLENSGQPFEVVEYLHAAPTEAELLGLIAMLEGPFASLVRTKDAKYQELLFDLTSKESVAKNLARYPELLERPIVIKGKRAVIGRPMENVKKLL